MPRAKPWDQIIAEATDDQAVRWYESVCRDEWPADMPVPQEAFEDVWHKLMKRAINVPVKKESKNNEG